MTDEQLTGVLALYDVKGLGHRTIGQLIEQAGGIESLLSTPGEVLSRWGVKAATAAAITSRSVTDEVKSEMDFIQRNKLRAIGFWEEDYPPLLRECPDAPVVLFGRGSFDFSSASLALSVVGTRAITPYGMSATAEIVQALAPYRPVIVSGLAYGVDGEAHKAALKYGLPTVGVLGQGLGTQLYPRQNRSLARQMCETAGSGIVTEYRHRVEALPGLFPARNRIVAGVSQATIVVEAKAKGGALITAHLAAGYNREVFALPGRTIDPCSAGCNALIRSNKAIMADHPGVIIEELGLALEEQKKKRKTGESAQAALSFPLTEEEKFIAEKLSRAEKIHLDELGVATGMPVYLLSSLLLEMELKGAVESLVGKYYALSPSLRGVSAF